MSLQKFQPEPFKPRDVFIPASEGDTKKEAPPPGEVEMKESPRSDEQLQQLAQREAEIQGFLAQKVCGRGKGLGLWLGGGGYAIRILSFFFACFSRVAYHVRYRGHGIAAKDK